VALSAVFSFLIYSIINAITPGPGNILTLNTVVNYGLKKSKSLLLGIFTGYYIIQIICALVIYGLDYFLKPAIAVMKYVGMAYIIWLAIHIALSKPELDNTDKKPSFWTGFILQFVNVKIYLFGLTALTGYVVPYYNTLVMLIVFEIIIATIGTISSLVWAFTGTLFKKIYVKHYRIINIILGLFLLECAVSLFFIK
jgi:cysteine/O-acetylserine efflux protein